MFRFVDFPYEEILFNIQLYDVFSTVSQNFLQLFAKSQFSNLKRCDRIVNQSYEYEPA